MILGSLVGGGMSLLGGLFGSKGGADVEKMMREQMEIAANSFSGINMNGLLGGGGFSFTPAEGGGISGINLQSSPFQQAMFGGLSDFGLNQLGMLGQDFGFNDLQNQSLAMLQGMDPNTNPFAQVNAMMQGSMGDIDALRQNPMWGNMGASLAGQGNDILSNLGSFEDYQGNTLALLREQARPAEERAGANMLERLFGAGQGGTTGGARNAAEFSRGLEQADIDRQLASYGEADRRRQMDFGIGQGLMGLGQGLSSFQDQLLGNALGRFGSLAQMSGSMGQQRFNNQANLAESMFGMGRAQMQQPFDMQNLIFGNLGNVLSGQGTLMDQQTGQLNTALQFMQAQANARNAQSGQAAQLAQLGGNKNFGLGSLFGDLGGAIGGENPLSGLGGWLDSIF